MPYCDMDVALDWRVNGSHSACKRMHFFLLCTNSDVDHARVCLLLPRHGGFRTKLVLPRAVHGRATLLMLKKFSGINVLVQHPPHVQHPPCLVQLSSSPQSTFFLSSSNCQYPANPSGTSIIAVRLTTNQTQK